VKKKAAAPKLKTKAKPKPKAKAKKIAKSTDNLKGLSALVRVTVGNDSPIQCNHRVLEANANVACAGPENGNGENNHNIDKEMSHLNLEDAACVDYQLDDTNDDAYEAIITVDPSTDHNTTFSSVPNNGVLSIDDNTVIIDEGLC
jgi:hypothetical protein